MKSYTDIEQSKALAKILPLESADMVYIWHATSDNHTFRFDDDMPPMVLKDVPINEITADTLPCWSLVALLSVIPKPDLIQNSEGTWMAHSWINAYPWSAGGYSNPVDSCYKLILKLNQHKML